MSNDVHIVAGIDAILNPNNIRPGIDLKELEQKMISGGLIQQKVRDPQDRLSEELNDLAQKIGVKFDGFAKPSKSSTKLPDTTLDTDLFKKDDYSTQRSPKYDNPPESDSDSESDEPEDEPEDYSFSEVKSPEPSNRFTEPSRFKFGGDLQSRTHEQERREHIDSVMGDDPNPNFSFEKEKREDVKCAMLAEIDSLMSSLVDEDIDLTRS